MRLNTFTNGDKLQKSVVYKGKSFSNGKDKLKNFKSSGKTVLRLDKFVFKTHFKDERLP